MTVCINYASRLVNKSTELFMTSTSAVPTLNDLERLYLSTKFCFGMGPGKSTAPLSAFRNVLSATSRCYMPQ
jgi:hypothetical protein